MVEHIQVCLQRGPLHLAPLCFAADRCFGTFSNYLGHLRGACHALGFEAPPVGHGAIKRAMIGIVKRQLSVPRPKHFIDRRACTQHADPRLRVCCLRTFVSNMVLSVQRGLEDTTFAMLWLISYTFLLRLPSEASACTAPLRLEPLLSRC